MYRVWDNIEKRWVKDGIFLSPLPNSDLYVLKKNFLGKDKLTLALDDRYVIHRFIELYDKDSNMVYEGDIIEAQISEDIVVIGIVTYAPELSSYIIVCFDPDEFYVLGSDICQYIKVIGNVFDTPDLIKDKGKENNIEVD